MSEHQPRDHHGRFTRPAEITAIEHLRARRAATAARMGLAPHPPAQIASAPGSKPPSLDGGLKPAAPAGRPADTGPARRDLAQARAEGVPLTHALGAFLGDLQSQ